MNMMTIGPMPFPFMGMPSQEKQSPPPRVKVAMDLIQFLSMKTMTKVFVNEVGFHPEEGQSLTTAEANAQATACNMLNDYFLGKMKITEWEKSSERKIEGTGTILQCFACAPGPTKSSCKLCKGTGQLLVFPTSEE